MVKLGYELARMNFKLRSGHAKGADQAFEEGCVNGNGSKEIYLPWSKFEGSNSLLIVRDPTAFKIAEYFHPYWNKLKEGAKKLQARNSHQVLGKDFKTKSDFIVCWTSDGKASGGTGQAIRIAEAFGIKVFNLKNYDNIHTACDEILKYSSELVQRNSTEVNFIEKHEYV